MAFREGFVEADGFRIRYMEAGAGHAAGASARRRRHAPDAGARSAEPALSGDRVRDAGVRPVAGEHAGRGRSASLAATMAAAVAALGIDQFNLMGPRSAARLRCGWRCSSRSGCRRWCWKRRRRSALPGHRPPSGTPEEIARRLYAHPERLPPLPRHRIRRYRRSSGRWSSRLRGPDRDADLEARMRRLATPTLVLFGTLDRVMPPDMGRHYKALLPNCHLVFVYDAGHEISTDRPEAFAEVTERFPANATRHSSSAAPRR